MVVAMSYTVFYSYCGCLPLVDNSIILIINSHNVWF